MTRGSVMTESLSDWIRLSQVSFPCTLGLFEWEQRQPQVLQVEIGLKLDLDAAAAGDLGRSVNYRMALDQIQFIAQHGRWLLLESMAAAMARHLLAPPAPGERRAQIRGVTIRLAKPNILGGRAIPSVEISRAQDFWAAPKSSASTGATIQPLQETQLTGAYRILLAPQARWTVPAGTAVHVISGTLLRDSEALGPGMAIARATGTFTSPSASAFIAVSQPPLSEVP
jgi:dihydroneopterin aldolase